MSRQILQFVCLDAVLGPLYFPIFALSPVRIVKDGLEDAPASTLYVTSVYWTVTTLSTVGYGDIFASTIAERTYCILVSCSCKCSAAAATRVLGGAPVFVGRP